MRVKGKRPCILTAKKEKAHTPCKRHVYRILQTFEGAGIHPCSQLAQCDYFLQTKNFYRKRMVHEQQKRGLPLCGSLFWFCYFLGIFCAVSSMDIIVSLKSQYVPFWPTTTAISTLGPCCQAIARTDSVKALSLTTSVRSAVHS